MENDSSKIVQSKNVLEFITVSNEFCIFINEIDTYESTFIYPYLQKVLPLLYLKGSLLPYVQTSHEEAYERFVTQEQWQDIYNKIHSKTSDKDLFLYIDTFDKTLTEPEQGSIAEFLADIYRDLKDFLLLYQKNTLAARENAVLHCKLLFESHWGLKLLNVHKAIHFLLFGKEKGEKNLYMGFSAN